MGRGLLDQFSAWVDSLYLLDPGPREGDRKRRVLRTSHPPADGLRRYRDIERGALSPEEFITRDAQKLSAYLLPILVRHANQLTPPSPRGYTRLCVEAAEVRFGGRTAHSRRLSSLRRVNAMREIVQWGAVAEVVDNCRAALKQMDRRLFRSVPAAKSAFQETLEHAGFCLWPDAGVDFRAEGLDAWRAKLERQLRVRVVDALADSFPWGVSGRYREAAFVAAGKVFALEPQQVEKLYRKHLCFERMTEHLTRRGCTSTYIKAATACYTRTRSLPRALQRIK